MHAPSLCCPSPELTCFGCCPPIRPAHYDPLDFVGSLRREFIENRERLMRDGPAPRPIVGFSCWALGFLDPKGHTAGCLLHPCQNGGRDLRPLIDYGNKCARESCVPARMFALLPEAGQSFWLTLVEGMNPFWFSSRKANPLFHLLGWGPELLEPLRGTAQRHGWSVTELLYEAPFLTDPSWKPQAHRFLFRCALEAGAAPAHLDERCHTLWEGLAKQSCAQALAPDAPYTHRLPIPPDLADFLRLGLGWPKATLAQAQALEAEVERLLGVFFLRHGLSRSSDQVQ